jgi:hypothetical protein
VLSGSVAGSTRHDGVMASSSGMRRGILERTPPACMCRRGSGYIEEDDRPNRHALLHWPPPTPVDTTRNSDRAPLVINSPPVFYSIDV